MGAWIQPRAAAQQARVAREALDRSLTRREDHRPRHKPAHPFCPSRNRHMTRVASIGECMIELSPAADGLLSRGFGGDTLNTAVYLARLGVAVDYVTALGDDPWSEEMLAAWRAEGVGTGLVVRVPGKLPGLYLIDTDADGQRRFYYWRDSAPARLLFDLPQTPEIAAALARYDLVYLSGVTLSLYGEAGRARLLDALDMVRARGGRIAFDTNFRTRGWPDREIAKAAFRAALARADIVLASTEDLELLFGADGAERAAHPRSACRGRAQAGAAGGSHLPGRRRRDRCRRARAQRRRHHGRRRQLRRRLSRRAPCRRPAGRGGAIGPSPRRRRRAPSRRDHPALGHAGRNHAEPGGPPMTVAASGVAETRRKHLRGHPARRAGDPRHHHRARPRRRAARARTRCRRPQGARDHAAHRPPPPPPPSPSSRRCRRRWSASARCSARTTSSPRARSRPASR